MNNSDIPKEIALWLTKVGREEILKSFRPNSCIASSKIAVEVCKYFNVPVKVMPVKARIFNPIYTSKINSGLSINRPEDAKVWEIEGCWSIGLGYGSLPDKFWEGHLVNIVDNRLLLDLSLDQVNSEEHNINIHAIAGEVNPNFIEGIDNMGFLVNKCLIEYRPDLDNQAYKLTRDWYNVSIIKRVSGDIIRQIKILRDSTI